MLADTRHWVMNLHEVTVDEDVLSSCSSYAYLKSD